MTHTHRSKAARRVRQGLLAVLALVNAASLVGWSDAPASAVEIPNGWQTGVVPQGTGQLVAVSCTNVEVCWAVGSDTSGSPEIITTKSSGTTWQTQNPPTGLDSLVAVSCSDNEHCVAGGSAGSADSPVRAVISTSNGGGTWVSDPVPVASGTIAGVACASHLVCWAVGTSSGAGFILATTDGGATWQEQASSSQFNLLTAIACPDTSHCFAGGGFAIAGSPGPGGAQPEPGGYGSLVEQTTDGGTTWTVEPSSKNLFSGYLAGPAPVGSLSCPTASRCMADGSGGWNGVFRTTDEGTTWSNAQAPGSPPFYLWAGLTCPDAESCRVVGPNGLLGTHNFGTTWSRDSGPPAGNSTAVACGNALRCVAVGDGSAAYTTGGGAYPGYWLAASDGGVFCFGSARFFGSTGNIHLVSPISSMAPTRDAGGYWLAARDGGVFTFGDARFLGSAANFHRGGRVVGIATTPDDRGYWLAAADGAVYSFGDAASLGSAYGHTTAPVVGIASTDGEQLGGPQGFWLASADGNVYPFGDATPQQSGSETQTGNMYGHHLNAPIVGIASAPAGYGGYWLVARDGGVFGFGVGFFGSTGAIRLNQPIVGMVAPDTGGYWLVAADGGIFSFGDANFSGSAVVYSPLNRPIVGMG